MTPHAPTLHDRAMPSTPTTCAQLAAMLVAVRDTDHRSPECERALLDLRDDDLATLEALCRLLPPDSVLALERAGDRPLWREGVSPGDVVRPLISQAGHQVMAVGYALSHAIADPVLRAADLAIQALEVTVAACTLKANDGQERVVYVARTTQRVMSMWRTVLSRVEAALSPLRDEAQERCLHLGRGATGCPTCGKSL